VSKRSTTAECNYSVAHEYLGREDTMDRIAVIVFVIALNAAGSPQEAAIRTRCSGPCWPTFMVRGS